MAATSVPDSTSVIVRELEGLDFVVAPWPHEGPAAETGPERSSTNGQTAAVSVLADAVASVAPAADFVAWIPAARQHRRERCFDQSELLGRAVARRLALPACSVFRRTDNNPQTTRTAQGRLHGPTLVARKRRRLMHTTMLLIDDVCTTGATLTAAATAWRRIGGARVVAATATSSV